MISQSDKQTLTLTQFHWTAYDAEQKGVNTSLDVSLTLLLLISVPNSFHENLQKPTHMELLQFFPPLIGPSGQTTKAGGKNSRDEHVNRHIRRW